MAETASVRVAVRVRPLTEGEANDGSQDAVLCQEEQKLVVLGSGNSDKKFGYDYVFGQHSCNGDIYTACVAPLLAKALDGYNVTVFAYGQTGSGKTFTMMEGFQEAAQGTELPHMGISPRLMKDLFDNLQKAGNVADFCVKVSCLEIYNENVYDLLSKDGAKTAKNVVIRDNEAGDQVVSGLTETKVISAAEMASVLNKGMSARATASTAMNSRSSRSHAVFTIIVEQQVMPEDGGEGAGAGAGASSSSSSAPAGLIKRTSRIHLVDLAGSERAKKTHASGERLKEGASINKSLLALGNVISALAGIEDAAAEAAEGGASKAMPGGHIPYRDSKLTRLLKSSLGGNAHTLMIACASPADSNTEETLSTLRYAARARAIKNKAVVNMDPMSIQLTALRAQVKSLTEALNAARAGLPLGDDVESLLGPVGSAAGRVRVELGDITNGGGAHAAPCPCGRTLELPCNGGTGSSSSGSGASVTDLAARLHQQKATMDRMLAEHNQQLHRLTNDKNRMADRANLAESDRDELVWTVQQLLGACRTAMSSARAAVESSGASSSSDPFSDLKAVLSHAELTCASAMANARAGELMEDEGEEDGMDWDSFDPLGDNTTAATGTTASSTTISAGASSKPSSAFTSSSSSSSDAMQEEAYFRGAVSLEGITAHGATTGLSSAAVPASKAGRAPAAPAAPLPSGLAKPTSGAAQASKAKVNAIRAELEAVNVQLRDKQRELQSYGPQPMAIAPTAGASSSSSAAAPSGTAGASLAAASLSLAQQKADLEALTRKFNAAVKERDELQTRLTGLQTRLKIAQGKTSSMPAGVGASGLASAASSASLLAGLSGDKDGLAKDKDTVQLSTDLESVKALLVAKDTEVAILKKKQEAANVLLAQKSRTDADRLKLEEDVAALRKHKNELAKSLKDEQNRARMELLRARNQASAAIRERDKIQLDLTRQKAFFEKAKVVHSRKAEENARLLKKFRELEQQVRSLKMEQRMQVAGLVADSTEGFTMATFTGPAALSAQDKAPSTNVDVYFAQAAALAAEKSAKAKEGRDLFSAFMTGQMGSSGVVYLEEDLAKEDGQGADQDAEILPGEAAREEAAEDISRPGAVISQVPADPLLALAACLTAKGNFGASVHAPLRGHIEAEMGARITLRRASDMSRWIIKERSKASAALRKARAEGGDPAAIRDLERQCAKLTVQLQLSDNVLLTAQSVLDQLASTKQKKGRKYGLEAMLDNTLPGDGTSAAESLARAKTTIMWLLHTNVALADCMQTALMSVAAERSRSQEQLREAHSEVVNAMDERARAHRLVETTKSELALAMGEWEGSGSLSPAVAERLLTGIAQLSDKRVESPELSELRKALKHAEQEAALLRVASTEAEKSLEALKQNGKIVSVARSMADVMAKQAAARSKEDGFGASGPMAGRAGAGPLVKPAKAEDMEVQPEEQGAGASHTHAHVHEDRHADEWEDAEDYEDDVPEDEDDEEFTDEDGPRAGKKRSRGSHVSKASGAAAAAALKRAKRSTCDCGRNGSGKAKLCVNCACQKDGRKCGDSCKCGSMCRNPHNLGIKPETSNGGAGPAASSSAASGADSALTTTVDVAMDEVGQTSSSTAPFAQAASGPMPTSSSTAAADHGDIDPGSAMDDDDGYMEMGAAFGMMHGQRSSVGAGPKASSSIGGSSSSGPSIQPFAAGIGGTKGFGLGAKKPVAPPVLAPSAASSSGVPVRASIGGSRTSNVMAPPARASIGGKALQPKAGANVNAASILGKASVKGPAFGSGLGREAPVQVNMLDRRGVGSSVASVLKPSNS